MARTSTPRRRALVAVVALTALLGLAPSAAQGMTAEPHARTVSKRICDYDWQRSRRQVRLLIECAARHWTSPGGAAKAVDVARCESGLRPRAHNPAGYAGVYQQAVRYWPDRADKWGFPHRSVYNGRANIIVSIRMANSADGWGIWGCG